MKLINELRISNWLLGICLSYMCLTWIVRFINHFYHLPILFFGIGALHVVLIWAFIERVNNYRRLKNKIKKI